MVDGSAGGCLLSLSLADRLIGSETCDGPDCNLCFQTVIDEMVMTHSLDHQVQVMMIGSSSLPRFIQRSASWPASWQLQHRTLGRPAKLAATASTDGMPVNGSLKATPIFTA
jgi:hypothetical protein